ncbi:MAG TPA: L-seryl-tRNA(Sec) selenium transferase [Verrucomicrobiales bacterium]|nr:L-seryl-tRNA(Sec) selenium transferase [Verrucomicrobiales bacterium]|tara:strand:+ start:443 stop:1780 length:1338 start_codon:yes stop_codon:yes gene_type:complete
MAKTNPTLRAIPGVDTLLETVADCPLPRPLVVNTIRAELAAIRKAENIPDADAITETIRQRLDDLALSRLQPVINGTGVVVHTNLGRAPIAPPTNTGYTNLEIDLTTGRRGKRAAYVEQCLAELCGAEAAMVTNNCAAALVLIVRQLTATKKEVVISRGELVQIGGGFRIPDILETSDAVLCEIGTTNRTNLEDYVKAICADTGLLLKVHRCNFFMDGFVASPNRRELAALARKKRVPFVEDLGSGVLLPTEDWAEGHHETTPREVLKAGTDLVCFSGDKMLGGPQAGIIAGKTKHIAALKKHPFFRALRCDKLILTALQDAAESYLRAEGESLPLNQALQADPTTLKRRANKLAKALADLPLQVTVREGASQVGGGALPQATLPSITLDLVPDDMALKEFATRLRRAALPVIGVIQGQRLRLDLRTVFPEQDKALTQSIQTIFQ